ncbi:MAG: site-2 protease family protein [Bacteroidota bacterium]|nr:site-2 protease family protein [Bacteroidota bacterium]
MNRSFNLGKIAGIKILMHWTFLLLLAWIIFSEVGKGSDTETILITVIFVLSIFFCVVLHELGHSLTAKKFGIGTKKITLLPIGGVASLERMPEDPKQELLIAVAGPAVNVAIAVLLLFFVDFSQYQNAENIPTAITPSNFLMFLFSVNVILVVFNAIPAFPMDGGRILRAFLAMRMDRVRATNIAASLGKFFAIAFILLGLFYNFFLIFIGIFVYFGAYAENTVVQHLELMKGFRVKDAMITNLSVLSPQDTIQDATQRLLAGSDIHFPVVDNGKVLGILTQERLINALQAKKHELTVVEVMEKDFESFDVNEKLTNVYAKSQRSKNFFSPVIQNDQLVGVINRENLNEFVMIRSAFDS